MDDILSPEDDKIRAAATDCLREMLATVRANASPSAQAAITASMAAFCFGSACAAMFNDSIARGVDTSPLIEAERLSSSCMASLRKKFGN